MASIIQVGSALSYRAIPLQAAYCGAKFGISGFTDSLRVELRADKSHVRITMVQLPGVNTTQFNWCRSKMPDHPQPVPPIYQPEIPAEAVYWAAHHRRRELWVGYSAVQAIVGSDACADAGRHLPGAHRHQRTADSGHAGRPATVRTTCSSPQPQLAATHGIFDDKAKSRSPELWTATHRRMLGRSPAGGGTRGRPAWPRRCAPRS